MFQYAIQGLDLLSFAARDSVVPRFLIWLYLITRARQLAITCYNLGKNFGWLTNHTYYDVDTDCAVDTTPIGYLLGTTTKRSSPTNVLIHKLYEWVIPGVFWCESSIIQSEGREVLRRISRRWWGKDWTKGSRCQWRHPNIGVLGLSNAPRRWTKPHCSHSRQIPSSRLWEPCYNCHALPPDVPSVHAPF